MKISKLKISKLNSQTKKIKKILKESLIIKASFIFKKLYKYNLLIGIITIHKKVIFILKKHNNL